MDKNERISQALDAYDQVFDDDQDLVLDLYFTDDDQVGIGIQA